MTLVSRYVFRECVGALAVVLGVLFLILLSNQFAEVLGDAAAGSLPREAVFPILGLTSLSYVTLLAPIGLFLGIMLALARLSRDSEMAALAACGIGPGRLLRPIGLLTLLLAGAMSWLALVETPAASRRIEQIKLDAQEALSISAIEAGKFASPDSGDTVVYTREVDGDHLVGVFAEQQVGDRVVAVVAERGKRVQDPATGLLSFVLFDGTRYEGVPGSRSFRILEFAEHGIPVRIEADDEYVPPIETRPTEALLASDDPADAAELQWRISSPLSLLVLALLAVPLSRSSPREGRYSRIGVGLLLYIIYANTLSIARVWLERGLVPEWLGLWWVHAAAALVGLALLAKESGWFASAPTVAGHERPPGLDAAREAG
ncbi:MAG TPA: LPS export ABC transporter permease LptF [Gammaproteobacteria bacterium]